MTTTGGVACRRATSSNAAETAAGVDASTPSARSTATTESRDTCTSRCSWSLYSVATPCAAASFASSGEIVTGAVLPDRGPAMRPRLRRFDLRSKSQQRHLVARAADELDTDGQPVIVPVQRNRHGRLAAHVVGRGERREPLLVLEVLRWVGVVAKPADLRRRLGERRGEDGVVRRGPVDLHPGTAAQSAECAVEVGRRQAVAALAQPARQWTHLRVQLSRERQRGELRRP